MIGSVVLDGFNVRELLRIFLAGGHGRADRNLIISIARYLYIVEIVEMSPI